MTMTMKAQLDARSSSSAAIHLVVLTEKFRCGPSRLDSKLLGGSVAVYRAPADFVVSADGNCLSFVAECRQREIVGSHM